VNIREIKLVLPEEGESFKPFTVANVAEFNDVWDALPAHSRISSDYMNQYGLQALLLNMMAITACGDHSDLESYLKIVLELEEKP